MEKVLRFDRGTLVLEGFSDLPAGLDRFFEFDARVDAFRSSCEQYQEIVKRLKGKISRNQAPRYSRFSLNQALEFDLYPHQQEALERWKTNDGRGVVVLPTGAGKSLVGVLALAWAGRSGLVIVPTIDLMHQWFGLLRAAFPDTEVGLLGGGYHDSNELMVATYDSAARHMDRLGNRFGILIADEVHHLPAGFYRNIAEFCLAPFRLGLTATPERGDFRHADLDRLIGPVVYRREAVELAGDVLAPYVVRQIYVELSALERADYEAARLRRDEYLQKIGVSLRSLDGWQRFVMLSARTPEGRQAMRAHQEVRRLSNAAPAKLRALEMILAEHATAKTVIFTEDNATVYELSKRFLVPSITHQTPVKERQSILESFKSGEYRVLATSKALNEGVDVPDAAIGVILSGSAVQREFIQRLGRILRRSEGKQAVLYQVVTRRTREEHAARRRQEPLQF
ncbi:MAG: DEAD/DEAH box helicase family protein [Blastocatellia bacterium]|nr:DEAD/DEAH box helicase family protein [Blastocatellia bacterium]